MDCVNGLLASTGGLFPDFGFGKIELGGLSLEQVELKLVLTLALLGGLLLLRRLVVRTAIQHVSRATERRRWVVHSRNLFVFLAVLGLTAIWAQALRAVAVSILAIGVAFVIATKELLQSILGSMQRALTNSYSVGDRIEIGSYRGDVIDQNLFTTSIMEVGPGKAFHLRTGRIVTFPNNKLLNTYVVNESQTGRYVVHAFSVPLKIEQDWERAEALLLEAARAECEPFLERARESMRNLEELHALDGLPAQPRSSIQIAEPGKVSILIRFPAPVGRQGRLEQTIIRRFLKEFYGTPQAAGSESAEKSADARPAAESTGAPPAGDAARPSG